jgi:hypothetical protein
MQHGSTSRRNVDAVLGAQSLTNRCPVGV